MRVSPDGTLVLPGRKTDRFLRMGVSKNLGGFGSGSRDMTHLSF